MWEAPDGKIRSYLYLSDQTAHGTATIGSTHTHPAMVGSFIQGPDIATRGVTHIHVGHQPAISPWSPLIAARHQPVVARRLAREGGKRKYNVHFGSCGAL